MYRYTSHVFAKKIYDYIQFKKSKTEVYAKLGGFLNEDFLIIDNISKIIEINENYVLHLLNWISVDTIYKFHFLW